MNIGLIEAATLAECLHQILREEAPNNLLESYNQHRKQEWQRLLGVSPTLRPAAQADKWIRERSRRILPCLPASGDDLISVTNQLGLEFTPASVPSPSA
jgi:2-polyprenyl-6-methoxyphenol hydroxylase-like FAD-dependent oxidoreductase